MIIAKNEATTILRTLNSVLDCADEYVIGVDHASTDDTLKIVRRFKRAHPEKAFEIYRFKWTNSFAAARNRAIEKCSGDWIFQLDGHEYLAPGQGESVRYHMQTVEDYVYLISVRMELEPQWPDGVPQIWFMQNHLWRTGDLKLEEPDGTTRLTRILYEGDSHNIFPLTICPAHHRMQTPLIRIIHHRTHENAEVRREQRKDMNTPYFLEVLKENPKNERALFYLGMSYADAAIIKDVRTGADLDYKTKLLKKAAPVFERYCQLFGRKRPEEAYEAASKLGEIYSILAEQAETRAQEIDPEIKELNWWLDRNGEQEWSAEYAFTLAARDALTSELRELVATQEKYYPRARRAFFRCCEYMPTRAEGWFNLGLLASKAMELTWRQYSQDGQAPTGQKRAEYDRRLFKWYREAERWYGVAVDMEPPITSYFLRAPIYIYLPLLKLAELNENVYYYTGTEEYFVRAKQYYEEVQRRLPWNREVRRKGRTLMENHDLYMRHKIQSPIVSTGKPTLAVFDHTRQFTTALMQRWAGKGAEWWQDKGEEGCIGERDVRRWREADYHRMLWGDMIFVDWVDKNLINISQRNWGKPVFARLHRYEAFTTNPRQVNWKNVAGLVVLTDRMKRYVLDSFAPDCPVHVIEFGLDLDRLTYKERGPGKNVAFVGYLHPRKNLMELADIVIREPGLRFHIAGTWQGRGDLRRYFNWRLQNAKEGTGCAADRVTMWGWQQDVDAWLDKIDANYLISTSWSETFATSVAEAMAKGIKPIMRRWEFADELYPPELIYDRVEDVWGMIHKDAYDSEAYRQWVAERYDADVAAKKYEKLFYGEKQCQLATRT